MSKHSLHTIGLIACGAKIFAGTIFYFFLAFAKETCVPSVGTKASRTCAADTTKFEKSFFFAAVLFFSMSFTLIPYMILRHNKPGVTKVTKQTFINLILPSALEFIGQTMFMIGVTFIPMSLSLTLKGARVVFSALLLVFVLGRKLYAFHWAAVAGTLIGLGVASLPSIISPSSNGKSSEQALIGIALTLGGEFIRSLRTVVEEKLMKKLKYDPLLVVGLQGIYALMLAIPTLFIVENIYMNNKPMEVFSVTWSQFTSSGIIIGLYATFPVAIPGLFVAGAYVTKLMSAVHNALTTIITNGIVWAMAIVVYYIDNSRGEELKALSGVQLLGFLIVVVASLMYDAIIRVPQLFFYPLDRAAASGAGSSEKSVLGLTSSESLTTDDEATKIDDDSDEEKK